MISFIVAATFFSVSFTGIALYFWFYQRFLSSGYQIGNRIEAFEETQKTKRAAAPFVIRDVKMSRIPLLNRVLEKVSLSKKIQKILVQADMEPRVGQGLILMAVLFMLGVLIGLQMQHPALGLVLGTASCLLMASLVIMRINRRMKSFSREFPDAIDMMTGALRAGHAFSKAMQLVAMEAPDPVGAEFNKTFEEHNLGRPLKECLVHFAERVPSPDLKLFVTAVLLQRETGGNLTEILEKISYTIRERFKLMGQIQVYTAQGRLSAWILGLLPIVFLLLISSLNPDYLKPLFTEKVGHYMLLLGGALQILGFLIIRKIVRLNFD
ncbi:type II secretion system F family protein [bacterium]|nr:type II secretion system F family protein [bacterium]